MPDRDGWRYELKLRSPARFRASGLDAAARVALRVNDIVNTALENDPEVIELEAHVFFAGDTPDCSRTRECKSNLHYDDCPLR